MTCTCAKLFAGAPVDYILTPVVAQVLKSKVSVFVDLFKKTQQVRLQSGSDCGKERRSCIQLTTASIAINSGARRLDKIIEIATETTRQIIEAHQAITLTIPGRYAKQPPTSRVLFTEVQQVAGSDAEVGEPCTAGGY